MFIKHSSAVVVLHNNISKSMIMDASNIGRFSSFAATALAVVILIRNNNGHWGSRRPNTKSLSFSMVYILIRACHKACICTCEWLVRVAPCGPKVFPPKQYEIWTFMDAIKYDLIQAWKKNSLNMPAKSRLGNTLRCDMMPCFSHAVKRFFPFDKQNRVFLQRFSSTDVVIWQARWKISQKSRSFISRIRWAKSP